MQEGDRELRVEAGLDGKSLAGLLGWQRSKVSRLQTGRQTATDEDLEAWAGAVGVPEQAAELKARLRGLESQQRHWRRQLSSGHAPVQDRYVVEYRRTGTNQSEDWPAAGTVGEFEIWWADSRQQIRLKPADSRYLRHDFADYVERFRPGWPSRPVTPVLRPSVSCTPRFDLMGRRPAESPMRQSGWLFLIHSQLARAWVAWGSNGCSTGPGSSTSSSRRPALTSNRRNLSH
ncbi:helix-turn-helix domain-containing protein [Streptomyces sp. NPDC051956]|uniref:helix-turn-helix domain-containing protein n=1 Tax=Streptomyces sp. NPDC051956 TaxID=3365677 RepID=UPI0037D9852B